MCTSVNTLNITGCSYWPSTVDFRGRKRGKRPIPVFSFVASHWKWRNAPYLWYEFRFLKIRIPFFWNSYNLSGGAILTNRYILSAAHCYSPSFKIEQYRVVVGAQDRDNDGTSYTLNKYTRHPKFTSVERSNDIGIIELTNEIVFNENVAAIDFDRTFIDGDQPAVFAGYGRSEVYKSNFFFGCYSNYVLKCVWKQISGWLYRSQVRAA